MSDNFTGPIPLGDLTHNECNFLCAAGQVGGFDPRVVVTAPHDEASAALGSGVYKGAGDGSLKNLTWQEFLNTKVRQFVKDAALKFVVNHANYDTFLAYSGSYQSQRKLMVYGLWVMNTAGSLPRQPKLMATNKMPVHRNAVGPLCWEFKLPLAA